MERYTSFAQTSIGASHISRGLICQDSSACVDREKYSFAAAADGHGSPCYLRTDRGSRFAVECAAECVSEFMEGLAEAEELLQDERQREELLNQLWRSIIARWHDVTEQDYLNDPFTEEELDRIPEDVFPGYRERYEEGEYIGAYGTTLVFAVVTDSYAFGAQIGDGKCVVIDCDSNIEAPIPDDPRCYENITTSMCQDDAALSARFFYLPKGMLPAAVFLCTDGVENSYWNEDQLFGFFRGLALTIVENGIEESVHQLSEFLPSMTKKGSGDDVSCAGIVHVRRLCSCSDGIREDLAASVIAAEAEAAAAAPPDDIVYVDEDMQQVVSDVIHEEENTPDEEAEQPNATDEEAEQPNTEPEAESEAAETAENTHEEKTEE
ncbi:MAG: protein phosphatase 2C domain-containing protein [Ruminococcus sp.]|uniref:PP2C family serine/threonine-protein phosphatase n=1 Tax=Ruminococcus sp. TaxID=41978 RepID=UPI0025F8663A|nr:PP2C family serine/threonine-protein phosphatase [Ruminococcus sp.]MCR5602023.1 protein phosphatase 2C domain-containing protein [Ruminococcus sp.]